MNLLARLGAALLAPRALVRDLAPGTGARDGLVFLGLYTLAVAVPDLGTAVAELLALGPSTSLVRAALPLFPWLVASVLLDWVLGPDRAHRTAPCMVPMLLVVAAAHLAGVPGPRLLGPADASMLAGAALSLALAIAVRNDIRPLPARPAQPPTNDPSPGTASAAANDLSPGTPTPGPAAPPPPSDLAPDLSPGTPTSPPPPESAARPTDLSPGTPATSGPPAPRRPAALVGLAVVALVAANAARDGLQLAQRWSTLAPLGPGEPLPALAVPLLDGGTLSLAALPPRPHLLVFWTTWCGVCRTEMPMLRALHTRYAPRGLQILLVNADDAPNQAALAAVYRDNQLLEDLPVALDAGPLRRAMRVRMYPTLVLVDAAGVPVMTHQGAIDERTLATAIESVLPAAPASAR